MRKIFSIAVAALLAASLAGCVSNSEYEALKKENELLREAADSEDVSSETPATNDSETQTGSSTQEYGIGEPITIQTDHGDYSVAVLSTSKSRELNEDGNYTLIVSYEIENISYDYSDQSDQFSMPWSNSRNAIIVSDEDRNILEYYDIAGPKEVHTPKNVPIGYKEQGSYAYFPVTPNVYPENVDVQVCKDAMPVGIVTVPVED